MVPDTLMAGDLRPEGTARLVKSLPLNGKTRLGVPHIQKEARYDGACLPAILAVESNDRRNPEAGWPAGLTESMCVRFSE